MQLWLGESEANRKIYQQMVAFWKDAPDRLPLAEQQSWDRISWKIERRETAGKVHQPTRQSWSYWPVAAACAALLLLAIAYLTFQPTEQPAEILMSSLSTQMGEKRIVHLSDGTKVKLNAGSELLFPIKFAGSTRRVRLHGEAFFDVAKNPEKPFVIETSGADIVVLGTSFNVAAYIDKPLTSIAVLTGKVKVKGHLGQQEVVLGPEYMAEINRTDGEMKTVRFNPDKVIGWKDGKLVFEGVSLEEVLHVVGQWYGYNIIIPSEINLSKKQDYYAIFDNASLKHVLDNLSFTYQFSFQINHSQKKVVLMRINPPP